MNISTLRFLFGLLALCFGPGIFAQTVDVRLSTLGNVSFSGTTSAIATNVSDSDTTIKKWQDKTQTKIVTINRYKGLNHSPITVAIPSDYELNFQTAVGDVSLNNLKATINGFIQAGNITLSNVQAKINLQTQKGNIKVSNSNLTGSLSSIEGNIEAENPNASLGLLSPTGATIHFNSSYPAERPLSYQLNKGTIVIDQAPKGANVRIQNGTIEVKSSVGFLKAHIEQKGDIIASDVRSGMNIYTAQGNIKVTLSKEQQGLSEPIDIQNEQGDIQLEIPSSLNDSIEVQLIQTQQLETPNELKSDITFSTLVPQSIYDADKKLKVYRLQGLYVNRLGKRAIRLKATNGNIRIIKL